MIARLLPASAYAELKSGPQLPALMSAVALACACFGFLMPAAVPMESLLTVGAAALSFFALALALVQYGKARHQCEVLAKEADELRRRLDQDPLTHLMNRAAFNNALDFRSASSPITGNVIVLFFDLDRFKEVNDRLGHKVGDHLLIEVARRAGAALTVATAFARLGGDEFAAIIPSTDGKCAEDYGHAIVQLLDEPFVIDGHAVQVAASVGIAIGDAVLDDGHELLRRADVAMYEAKGSPRGACRIYDDMLSVRQKRESVIRAELGQSMMEQAFDLHFQPIFDARSGRYSKAEALLRSQSARLVDVTTTSLIDIAEASGQIIELTEWTIDTALAASRELETSPVAVNTSPVYFRQPDFVQRMFDKLLSTRTPPELLTVEVTEGVLIADLPSARQSISRLREIGVQVYLDDFGTGYSSLGYLQHFVLDGLKLDKSFIRDVGDRRKATQIIRSIVDFAHSLDMSVVVEGVESDWQVRLLQLLGCDYLQGYELGMPMPLEELIAFRADADKAVPHTEAEKGEGEDPVWPLRAAQ
jgi:diguanylate cyclase (GGDEF)-like protein